MATFLKGLHTSFAFGFVTVRGGRLITVAATLFTVLIYSMHPCLLLTIVLIAHLKPASLAFPLPELLLCTLLPLSQHVHIAFILTVLFDGCQKLVQYTV